MTASEFRSSRARCDWLKRILEANTMKEALEAAFKEIDMDHAVQIARNPDASERLELRLMNQRQGAINLRTILEQMTEPTVPAQELPDPDYGAGQPPADQINPWTQPQPA